ncbi:hypothetical protein M758_3G133700 [Ceratodon purpureus]|nr:hypothetical protein M758_3G133700 [Ceratodon purpureus]
MFLVLEMPVKVEVSDAALEQIREGKRKEVEDEVAPIGKKHAGPKYDLDPITLECPFCLEVFTPPVYQVECKHACHGCNTMLKYTERAKHEEKLCEYRPIPCPVTRYPRHCSYAGPKASIPAHLQFEHNMRTVERSGTKSASFLSRFSLATGGVLFKAKEVWLMVSRLEHFEVDVFRCDSVGASEDVKYRLRVKPVDKSSRVFSMENVAYCKTGGASSQDKEFLLVPGVSGEAEIRVMLI